MANNNLVMQAMLRLGLDQASLSKAKAGFGTLFKAVLNVEDAVNSLNEGISTLNETTQVWAEAAQSALQPLNDATDAYVMQMGLADEASRKWIRTQERMQDANVRLGASAARALQPFQDKLADIIDLTTDFITQHPQLLQAGVGIAATILAATTAVNAATQVASTVQAMVAAVNKMRSLGSPASAVGAAGILAVGLPAAAVGGMALGKGLSSAFNKDKASDAKIQAQTLMDVLKPVILSFALGVDSVTRIFKFLGLAAQGLADVLKKAMLDLDVMFGKISKEDADKQKAELDAAKKARFAEFESGKGSVYNNVMAGIDRFIATIQTAAAPQSKTYDKGFGQSLLDSYAQFEKQLEEDEKRYLEDRNKMIADFNRQALQAQEEFNRQQAQAQEDFAYERGLQEKAHAEEMQTATSDFREQQLQAQKDFLKQQERAEEDHRYRLEDAAARLDALAVIQELRQHATDKKRADEDFKAQQKQAAAQFKKDMQRREEDFRKQQALAAEQFKRQMARAAEEFRYRQQQEAEAFNRQIQEADAAYQNQLALAQAHFRDQITEQMNYQNWSESELDAYYNRLASKLNAFMSQTSGGGGTSLGGGSNFVQNSDGSYTRITDMDTGGYTGSGGLRNTHPGEYMLTAKTTSALEGMAGGRLSQARVMALASSRGAGGGGLNVQNIFQDVGQHTIGELTEMVQTVMVKTFRDYAERAGV